MSNQGKRLRIMAGPNGSGKSTILKEVRNNFYSGPFVNADEIEKSLQEKRLLNLGADYGLEIQSHAFTEFLEGDGKSWLSKATKSKVAVTIEEKEGMLFVPGKPSNYDAALAADFVRNQLLMKEDTFTFETVLSHPSKVELLKKSLDLGYKNYLYFICTVDPNINIERVAQRSALGGHSVPEEKIRSRYHHSLEVLPEIIPYCYRVYLFDNSSKERRSIDPVASIDNSHVFFSHTDSMPWWVDEYVVNKLYR